MAVSFYIDKPANGLSTIFLQIFYLKNRIRITTGQKIDSKFWGTSSSKYRVSNKCILSGSINNLLSNWENKSLSVLASAKINNYSLDDFKDKLYESLDLSIKKAISQHETFLPFFNKWAYCGTPSKLNPHRGDTYSYRLIVEFTKYYCNEDITFNSIDYNYYNNLMAYLRDVKKLRPNSIATHVKNIRAVMNEAYKRGLHSNMDYLRFKKITEQVDSVYLTAHELENIKTIDLIGRLSISRDLFLIGCYTCMRYSDYSRITPDWMKEKENGKYEIVYTEQKTQNRNIVPAHPVLVEILRKYSFNSPKIALQHLNADIKEICKRAGIVDKITITRSQGCDKITEIKGLNVRL
ncbi:MAG: site-specific integrase [Bacteroidales bacterium]